METQQLSSQLSKHKMSLYASLPKQMSNFKSVNDEKLLLN